MSTIVLDPPRSAGTRVRAALLGAWAVVTGAAPHVLHHVGPLVGTALVAGAAGRIGFGALGFVAMVPTLRRLHRRTRSWRAPALALVAFATVFTFSTVVVGPALTADGGEEAPAVPADDDHHGHVPAEGSR